MDELIWKQDAADLLRMAIIDGWEPEYAEDKLKALPPVQPKRGKWEYHSNPTIGINPETALRCSRLESVLWIFRKKRCRGVQKDYEERWIRGFIAV